MKAILTNSNIQVPAIGEYFGSGLYSRNPEVRQDFLIHGKEIDFEVRMTSTSGFRLPADCDIDIEMKFTFVPKTPKTETITLK